MESHDDIGARVIAARAYARLGQDDLAQKVRAAGFRFSRRTLDRLEAGERHLDIREARVIAEATGVPLTFLVRGWWAPIDLAERVDALAAAVSSAKEERDALIARIDSLEDELQTQLATVVTESSTPSQTPTAASDRLAGRDR